MQRIAALICAVGLVVGCSSDEGSIEELCEAWRAVPDATTLFAGFDPSDAPKAKDQVAAGMAVLHELRDAAPKDARADLDLEIAYFEALVDALATLDGSDPEQAATVVASVTADHPGVADAAARLRSLTEESCPAA